MVFPFCVLTVLGNWMLCLNNVKRSFTVIFDPNASQQESDLPSLGPGTSTPDGVVQLHVYPCTYTNKLMCPRSSRTDRDAPIKQRVSPYPAPTTGPRQGAAIRLMRVSIWPIRITGSWKYLAGSWWEANLHFIVILIDIRENAI